MWVKRLKNAGFDQQRFRVRITAHEVAVEFRGGLAVALAEDAAAEIAPGLRVQHSFLQEAAESVRFQHLRPFVGVVAGGIAVGSAKMCVRRRATEGPRSVIGTR